MCCVRSLSVSFTFRSKHKASAAMEQAAMEQAAMLASKLPAADPSSTFLSRGDVMHHAVGIRPHDLVIVQWRLHETTKPPGPWIVWWGICKFGLVRESKDEDDRTAWI